MHSSQQPILYIIAGPNGAGKTTASFNVLPTLLNCREFVNADEIARGLSPFDVESVAIQAGKLMLERIEFLLKQGQTFAIETTLVTNSYTNLVSRAHALGYEVHLLFFWLSSPEVAYESEFFYKKYLKSVYLMIFNSLGLFYLKYYGYLCTRNNNSITLYRYAGRKTRKTGDALQDNRSH